MDAGFGSRRRNLGRGAKFLRHSFGGIAGEIPF